MMRSMDLRKPGFSGRALVLLLSLLLLSSFFTACQTGGADNGNDTLESVAEKTGAYLDSYDTAEKAAAGKEWVFLGLTLAGRIEDRERNAYLDSVAGYVREKGGNRLHENKSTENSRVILGILSAGGDPEAIGGQDLLKGLSDLSYVRQQGNNGPMWALMAIDAIREQKKAAGQEETEETGAFREALIDSILGAQKEDGGYAMMNGESDADLSGMAIQALAPYRDREEVRACIDRILKHLSDRQKEDGTFEGYGFRTSESVSQVILALATLGIRPEDDGRFIKNGITLTDALFSFRTGSGFKHLLKDEGVNAIATEQAFLALNALIGLQEGKAFRYVRAE